MSIYYCENCDLYLDGDWDPCVEHPTDDTKTICESCAETMQEDEVA